MSDGPPFWLDHCNGNKASFTFGGGGWGVGLPVRYSLPSSSSSTIRFVFSTISFSRVVSVSTWAVLSILGVGEGKSLEKPRWVNRKYDFYGFTLQVGKLWVQNRAVIICRGQMGNDKSNAKFFLRKTGSSLGPRDS